MSQDEIDYVCSKECMAICLNYAGAKADAEHFEQEYNRLRRALEHIIKHQSIVCGGKTNLSTTYNIAYRALNPETET